MKYFDLKEETLNYKEKQKKYLDIDFLKQNCSKIHAFGLGFIQIKLDEIFRVHVYTKEVTLTTQEEEIHNHRYNFKSTVMQGVLKNKLYQVKEDALGNCLMVNEACNPNLPKDNSFITVQEPILISEFNTGQGQSYFIDKDVFHQVEALEGTVTLLERGPVVKTNAQIIHPRGINLTCPFSVNKSEAELWEIVRRILS